MVMRQFFTFAGMDTTHIELFGLTVTEPFTWITNWLVAAFCFYFGHLLYHDKKADRQARYWALFFLIIGIASITGGTAHGFILYVGQNFHYAAWAITGVAVFAAQLAALEIIRHSTYYKPLLWLIIVELVVNISAVFIFKHLDVLRINSAVGLLGLVLPLQLYAWRQKGQIRNGIIALGIVSNLIPALIHSMRLSYNRWFNFNDLSHVVMIGCFYIIFVGARNAWQGRKQLSPDRQQA